MNEQPLDHLQGLASDELPPVLAQLVSATHAPFLQAIFDALSPAFAKGRIALVSDAACTLRPHTGSVTSKAANDAVTLAESRPHSSTDVVQTLAGRARQRRIAVDPPLLNGPQWAHSFGLRYPLS